MATNQKATVYIDVDDEITAIIDKVTSSKERIVALVLPKRAAVLQSIVNMKLLKRSAETAKKHVVLITTESGLLPLAGAVGMYVAPSLQSKPMIPIGPDGNLADDADEYDDFDPDSAADKPIGQLAGASAVMKDDMETIELDDDAEDGAVAAGAAGAGAGVAVGAVAKAAKPKKNGKLSVPDFNKFRLGLMLGGAALVALIVFLYFANFVLPKATITIATDSSDITTSANITLDPNAKELDVADKIFPAKIEAKKITGTQQVQATGSKNKGEKATGTVTVTYCGPDASITLPAGQGFSANGKTFISQDAVKVPQSNFTFGGSTCKKDGKATVDVVAASAGAGFNMDAATYTIAKSSGVDTTYLTAAGSAMAGGTDNIVKVVAQADIDSAKNKISSGDTANATKAELAANLEDAGYIPVKNSAQASEPAVTPSAAVGDEADVVTVTAVTTHTMYGVRKTEVETFIQQNIKDKIDTSKQQVLDTGLSKATFDIAQPASSGKLAVAFSSTSTAGPDIKTEALKKQLAGKKTNDVRTLIKQTPGVTDVSVKYSPFWVGKVPKKESKVTIVIQKSNATSANGAKKTNGTNP